MSDGIHKAYFSEMTVNRSIRLPKVLSTIKWLLVASILLSFAILWFTPWIQTAYGDGVVSSQNPNDRVQSISALVAGQVKQWHVREGDRVKAGDPIVTLVDSDPALLERLQAQIDAAQQERAANMLALQTEEGNLARQRDLQQQGLTSQRDIEKLMVEIQALKAKISKVEAELNKLAVEKARLSLQTKTAPADGVILNLLSAGDATFVKPGDVVASFVPEGVERSVVLSINGLDAAIVSPGRKVRLQFEGWPVIQFSGWPEVSVGTFGGVVEFVEPIAGSTGLFRVWVAPDAEDEPWPSEHFARLGSRVRGWVLLEEVALGYELWRLMNNFPPQNPSTGNSAQ